MSQVTPSKFEPKDLVAALSMAIRLRRMELNRSQEGLSYGAGFSRGYLSDVERGVRSISLKNFIRIANSLDIDPSELWKQAENLLKDGTEIDLNYGKEKSDNVDEELDQKLINCQAEDVEEIEAAAKTEVVSRPEPVFASLSSALVNGF